ncbi:hypothetical protein DY000_02046709, partial [Brassica cretica]
MTEFPSTTERTVDSSLLLLSYEPVFFSPTRLGSVEKSSYFGSVLSCDGNDHGFEIKYAGDRFSLMNLKVTWGSFNFVKSVCDLSTCSVDSKEESSCLSTGSSEVTTTASRSKLRNQKGYER